MKRLMLVFAALAVAIVAAPTGLAKPGPKEKPPKLTTVKLLAFNDFHGHLEAGTPGSIADPCCTGLRTSPCRAAPSTSRRT